MLQRLLFAAATSVMLASPGLAFNEPASFRGIPWKAPEVSVRAMWPELHCHTPANPIYWTRLCSTLDPVTIEGVPVKPTVGFRSDEFGYVALAFGMAHYPTVERFFVERYGPPTRQEQQAPGPAGAPVTHEVLEWIGPNVSITLEKYGHSPTEGRARFRFLGG
jgi:hypothetical protein